MKGFHTACKFLRGNSGLIISVLDNGTEHKLWVTKSALDGKFYFRHTCPDKGTALRYMKQALVYHRDLLNGLIESDFTTAA